MPLALSHSAFSTYRLLLGRLALGRLLALLLLVGAAATARAQQATPPPPCSQDEKFANQWYFGYKAGLDFNSASADSLPKVLTNGQMTAPAGSGVMADAMGNLVFYSNGDTVWSKNHAVMLNGTGLAGSPLVTDGPLAIRQPVDLASVNPNDPVHYYIFTQDAKGGPKGLSYSEIVVPMGQQGQVLTTVKNKHLAFGTAEKMSGVFDDTGCGIWVIVHGYGPATSGKDYRGDSFLAYHVTTAGVDTIPQISTIGLLHAPSAGPQTYRGQMKITPDGKRLAVARYGVNATATDSTGTVEVFNFDNKASGGKVSNRKLVDKGAGRYYGVEFSPSKTYLYATVDSVAQLLQFDLVKDTTNIQGSKKVIPLKQKQYANLGSLQAAPDGKIYVARQNQPALGFIAYPDSIGPKCRYVDDSLKLKGRLSGLGLPNFNQSSLLRAGPGVQLIACGVVSFQASPPIPNPISYAWTFKKLDGTVLGTSTLQNLNFTFDVGMSYLVTLRITYQCFCRESTGQFFVPGPPTPGTIGSPQTLCGPGTPAPLTSTAPAGAGNGQFSYQWQQSTDGINFTDITTGGTGLGYAPPALSATMYYRRLVTSGFCGPRTPSPSVAITVLPALTAGSIQADQTVCVGTAPAPLTSSADATGGTGTATYQWEQSADNVTFTAIGGATGTGYSPGLLPSTTYFRRRALSGPCVSGPTNVVTITVVPGLVAGSIAASQSLCAGAAPAPLTSVAPATGGAGGVAYQWQVSTDNGGTFAAAPGTNNNDSYAPGVLAGTTYFRRQASAGSACAPVYSNVVIIQVAPALAAGIIGAAQTICPGATPAPLTSTAAASGGTGGYSYQWERSLDNSTFTAIGSATGDSYAPPALTTTTYYRRQVVSGPCGPVYTASVAITVLPALTPGGIRVDQTICANTAPAPLTSTGSASGGTGTYAYQWEQSTDNVTFTAAPGPNTGDSYAPGVLTTTTYYHRLVTSGSGSCATGVSNVVTVTVQPVVTPTVTLAQPPTQCAGTPLTFTAVATGAGAAPSYQWLVNGTAVASGPTFTSSTLATGDQVQVVVTPTAGLCSTGPATATVTVTRTPTTPPTLAIQVQPNAPVCPGDLLTFSISSVTGAGAAPNYQWQVNGSDVTGATGPTFSSTTLRDGQTVTLRLRTTDACGQPATVTSSGVNVRILAPVQVDAGPDKLILAGTSVTLEGSVSGGATPTWTPNNTLFFEPGGDATHPLASPLTTTTYTLSAGSGGCASSDQVTVTVLEPIRIFSAFTPNGDGTDDTWQITNIENFPDNTVSIFNRWGNRIYSTTGYKPGNEWNGTINGQPAPIGTYYYIVVTKGPLGRSYSGPVTVLY